MTTAEIAPQSASPFSHRVIGAAARVAAAVLRFLPVLVSTLVADFVAGFLFLGSWLREKRVGRGVHRNLRIAFRDALTPARARRIRWAWARHMAWLIIDFVHMPRIQQETLERFVDCSEWDALEAEYRKSKGLICVTGHIGVAELLGHVASLHGATVHGVFRPSGIPPLEEFLRGIRTSGGQQVLSKWGVNWALKKALDRGEAIGLAGDENTPKNPVFVPFLGTPAATTSTPALLHRATGAPVAVATVHRTGRLRYKLHVWDVIRVPATDDKDADVAATLTRINAALSEAIRSYPEQWFWGSRRFYTRPADEKPGVDGLPPPAADGGVLPADGDAGAIVPTPLT